MAASSALVKIQGARELRRTLKQAGEDLADYKEAGREAGQIVVGRAKPDSPIGPDRNGHIRDTIRVSVTKTRVAIRAGSKKLPYGGAIHWGWPKHGIRPNPWIRDAAAGTESQWIQIYQQHMDDIIAAVKGA